LAAALDAILAGKPVEVAETKSPGCLIGRDLEPLADSQVTYAKHVAPIFNAHCVGCHRPGQIGPFTLTSYEDAAGWASMIGEVVEQKRMPPWHADEKFGHFQNNAELSAEERDTIAKWVAAGAPEGNPADLPPAPEFFEGWNISQPDQVVYMTSEVPFEVPATGVVDYQYFPVDPGWTEDKWIKEIELRPGNASVVHHIMLLVVPPGGPLSGGVGAGNDFLWAYAPGLIMKPLPKGMARFVPAGSRLVFQVHYTPNGKPARDQSYCGFVFADKADVRQEVRINSAPNFVFQIPPGDPDFGVQSRYIFREDSLLLSLFPHMHARGKAFRFDVTYPDGKK
jgi:mono/diheme cytochrome c family protein